MKMLNRNIASVRMSFINFEKDMLVIPCLYEEKEINIPFKEDESFYDLLKNNVLISCASIYDIIPSHWFPEPEEQYETEIKYRWPWSLYVYEYENYYIISHGDLATQCPSCSESLTAIPKNWIGLMAFFKEYCLPFIR